MKPSRRLSRRRVLLTVPAVVLAAKVAVPAPAQALKKKPECVADLFGTS